MTIPIRLREPKVEMKHKPHIMDVSIFEYLKNSGNVTHWEIGNAIRNSNT